MTRDQELLRQVFLWLASRYRRIVADLSGNLLEIHALVSEKYVSFQDVELERLLSSDGAFDSLDSGQFLILEPSSLGSPMIPVLSFSYDFHRSHPEFRLRLALFLFDELDKKDKLRAVGYRFESPEGEGIHHFYHAQIIRAFKKNTEQWRLPGPDWLPTKQPAFALDACSPVTLIVCLLISIYGRDFIAELRHAQFWDELKSHIEVLMSSNRSFQPTYWEVTFGKSKRFYKTWEKDAKFKQVMKNAKKASSVKQVTFTEYHVQGESSKFVY